MQNVFVAQSSINDCGAACLAMILRLRGKKVSLKTIKDGLMMDEDGVSAYDIIKLSKNYGISATGYKMFALDNFKEPFIAHLVNDDQRQHFVVVLKVTKDKVLVADPAYKISYVDKERFIKHYTGVAILFESSEGLSVFSMVSKQLCAKLLILSLLLCLLGILIPYFLSSIVKMISNKTVLSPIIWCLFVYFLLMVLKALINYVKQKLSLSFQVLLDSRLTISVIERLIYLPHQFYQRHGSGELISKLNDLSYVKEMVFTIVEVLPVNAILILGALIIFGFISVKIMFVNLLLIFSFYIINKRFFKKHYFQTRDLQIRNEGLNNSVSDFVNNILTIKNLVKEKYFVNDLSASYESTLKLYKRLAKDTFKNELNLSLIISIVTILIMFMLVKDGASLVALLFILSLEDIIISATTEISKLQPMYAEFKSAYSRIKTLWLENTKEDGEELVNVCHIQFKNVSFNYQDKPILSNVSFRVNAGDWLMVLGSTGAGKSTLFKLLTKQLSSSNIGIYVNDKEISCLNGNLLRKRITYVDQKVRLLSKTVRNNVYFDSEGEFKQMDELLSSMNVSYDKVIDNVNANVSGGQAQLITIMQSLVNGGDVIIFDETTSQLDTKSERQVLEYIKNNYPYKTIILISHRGSNADLFNKIIKFENGRITNVKTRRKHAKIKR